jgi:two-component system, OmpR family, sensor kinase
VTGLPVRVRITLGFAVAVAIVLAVVGTVTYSLLAVGFSADLDRELRQRAQDLTPVVAQRGAPLADAAGSGFIERGESFAEVVTPAGRVLQATATLHGSALLSRAEASRATTGAFFLDRRDAPGLNEPARLLATPIPTAGHPAVLVVGNTRENGAEALRRVRTQLLIGLPLLLVLTSGLGYRLTGAALRPVEEMRRRAAAMSGAGAGQRLPVPPGNDELARLGSTLNELLARVEATLVRERAFVANASHELRTPLALMRTELELAVRRPRPVAELTGAIASASEEVQRLTRLADDLLVLATAEDAGMRVELVPVEVPPLLARLAARFRATAAGLGRDIRIDSGRVASVKADPDRLEQALGNLIANALQHGDGAVTVAARATADAVVFEVTDEGNGFSSAMLSHGFERFAHSSSGGGSGLGLSVVAAVSRAHGGCAGIGNPAMSGAQAWIRLPSRTRDPRAPSC